MPAVSPVDIPLNQRYKIFNTCRLNPAWFILVKCRFVGYSSDCV